MLLILSSQGYATRRRRTTCLGVLTKRIPCDDLALVLAPYDLLVPHKCEGSRSCGGSFGCRVLMTSEICPI